MLLKPNYGGGTLEERNKCQSTIKITDAHIFWVQGFIKGYKDKLVTVKMDQNWLNRKTSLEWLLTFSVHKILKREIKMPYKKVDEISAKVFTKDRLQRFAESSKLILKLTQMGI